VVRSIQLEAHGDRPADNKDWSRIFVVIQEDDKSGRKLRREAVGDESLRADPN